MVTCLSPRTFKSRAARPGCAVGCAACQHQGRSVYRRQLRSLALLTCNGVWPSSLSGSAPTRPAYSIGIHRPDRSLVAVTQARPPRPLCLFAIGQMCEEGGTWTHVASAQNVTLATYVGVVPPSPFKGPLLLRPRAASIRRRRAGTGLLQVAAGAEGRSRPEPWHGDNPPESRAISGRRRASVIGRSQLEGPWARPGPAAAASVSGTSGCIAQGMLPLPVASQEPYGGWDREAGLSK